MLYYVGRCCPIESKKKKSKREYDIQYAKEHLKRIPLDVPKASYNEIKAHAAAHGETVNGFIKRSITETMERDQANSAKNQAPQYDADDESIPFLERVKAGVERIAEEDAIHEDDFEEWLKTRSEGVCDLTDDTI